MKPLTITAVAATLAEAWAQALPGKETCERDAVLRELQTSHRREVLSAPIKPQLRLVVK